MLYAWGELTEVTVGHRVLLDVTTEGAQFLQFELLGVDLVAQPLQAVLLGGQRRAVVVATVVVAALVVMAQVLEALLPGDQHLLLGLDLLLLARGHLL